MRAVNEKYELGVSANKLPASSETVGDVIRQIEAKYDLLQYEVDGWCVWPVMRFPVALALMDLPFTASKEPFRLRELLSVAVKDLPHLFFPRTSRYAVVTFSSALVEQEDEHYKDIFFDDLLRELGSFFKIEKLNSKGFFARSNAALIKSDVTSTAFDLLLGFVLLRFGCSLHISKVAESLSANLSQEPGLGTFTSKRIAAFLQDFYWRKKLYSWLLRRINPEYLFSADGYGDHAVIAAAKEQGIKVCEFQHGGFIRNGPEYGWSSYASIYKTKMPIPDQFFLFGDYWKKQLETDGFWDECLTVVGNLRVDQYRKRKTPHQSSKNSVCKIVLTTQGIDTQKLIAFVSDFVNLAYEKLDLELYIKLHPAYETDKGIYKSAFFKNKQVQVISGSEAPSTFELLSNAHLHLSISSTCHFDALGLGVPTVIIPLSNSSWVLPLYRAGYAFLASSPKALLKIVLELKHHSIPDCTGTYFFRPGALENIKRVLGISRS